MQFIIEQIIIFIGRLRDIISKKPGRFKVGDLVILRDGSGYPMLVTEIQKTKQMTEPLLYCRWYDRGTKETRFNFFAESNLQHFDWSNQA